MLNIRKILTGLGIVPKTTAASDSAGELEVISSNSNKLTYHNGTTRSPVVTEAHSATLTNKTLTSPVINTGVSGTAIDTDGTLAANSDTLLASQKAIKTYVTASSGAVQTHVDNLTTLSGVAADSTNLGTFTGTTIPDNQTNKQALQALETAVETKASSSLTSAHLLVGNVSNVATDVAVSGDLTLNNAGNFQIASGVIVDADINASAAIDASKIADGSVSSAEFQFINSLTSNAQTQINTKVTGPASATDEAIVRFDGTTGKLVKNGVGTISTAGVVAGLTGLTTSGNAVFTGPVQLSNYLIEDLTTDSSTTGSNATLTVPATPVIRLTNASLVSIDTITSPTAGRSITIRNLTGNAIILNNDTGATAANRFYTGTGANLTLKNQASVIAKYDGTSSRWMIIGINDSSSSGSTSASNLISNLGIAATVASSALTISIKTAAGSTPAVGDKATVGFRNSTAGTGQYSLVDITAALTTVISSGSTAGQKNGVAAFLYVYLINNAGTAEVAWSRSLFDEGSLITTTAEGGAGAADSASVLYSTTARSNVPIRLIGRLLNTQTTAGTWAAVPTEISVVPFDVQMAYASYGKANQSISNATLTTITFDSQTRDNYSAMNTSTGEYTIPNTGEYLITFIAQLSGSTAWGVGETAENRLYIDGTETLDGLLYLPATSATSIGIAPPSVIYQGRLTAGQIVTGRIRQDSGSTISTTNSANYTRITVAQLSK